MTCPVAVVVPYRTTDPHRERLWDWCERRWRSLLPGVPIVLGVPDAGPFNRSQAINRGVAAANARVVICADSDIAVDREWVEAAVAAASALLVCAAPADDLPLFDSSPAVVDFEGVNSWGGLVAFPTSALDVIGGADERFGKWGPEDGAFGLAMDALWAPHVRCPGRYLHLWHEPATNGEWDEGVPELFGRYLEAAGDADLMREVVTR